MQSNLIRAGNRLAEIMPSQVGAEATITRIGTINTVYDTGGYWTADVDMSGGTLMSGRARGVVPLGLSLRVVILRRLRLLLAGGLSCARLRPRSAVPANTVWRSTSWTRTVSVKRIGVPRRRRRTAAR